MPDLLLFLLLPSFGFIIVPTVGFGFLSLFEGFPRIKIGQIAGFIACSAWLMGLVSVDRSELDSYLLLSGIIIHLVFFSCWKREFRLLMLRTDDEFPGRYDRIVWFLMLTIGAPAGVWFYRAYRKSVRPGPKTVRSDQSNPWDGEPSPDRARVE